MVKHVLSFLIQPLDDPHVQVLTLTPVVSGTPLTELVSQFEQNQAFDPAGGYGGLIPKWFEYGPIDRYFNGQSADPYWKESKGLYLLGCNCGEVGCWPLVGHVTKIGAAIVWDNFSQPHRPDRDYSSFGPFSFDAEQYKAAVSEMSAQFEDT